MPDHSEPALEYMRMSCAELLINFVDLKCLKCQKEYGRADLMHM